MSMMPGKYVVIEGTLDLVTPPDTMPPGRAISSKNYEPVARGAQRFTGYERFDGQPKPSDATYSLLNFDAGTATITEGQTVTGATSAATGKTLIDMVVSTGSFGASNAAGYLIITNVSGTFQDNENLQVSAVTKCVANGVALSRGASTDALDTTYYRDAIETARTLIAKPTGSGRIRGVWKHKGVRYCFRDNAGATAGGMWKATASGWTAVDLGHRVDFTSGGTYVIAEGNTITGATSAATGIVRRVILSSGSWAAGDAAGTLIVYTKTGTFQAENLNVGANMNVATIAADLTAQTLAAGGTYRLTSHNFYGASDYNRMYGVNGVNKAFEFDGDYFVLIATGMTSDLPTHIGVHKNQLFLGFAGGSLQNSSIGDPYDWNVLTGAAEIGVGHTITNLQSGWNDAMVVTGRGVLRILYGNDSDDFVIDDTSEYAGAYADTMQLVGVPIYMDDTGLRRLTVQDAGFGNFNIGTLSRLIEPYFKAKRDAGTLPTCSVVSKRKDQYRIFFDDATALFVYFGRRTRERLPMILPLTFGTTIRCACSTVCLTGTDANEEVILCGGDDGYVYEFDVGTSFDGAQIEAWHRLAWDNQGSFNMRKAWKKAVVRMDTDPSATILATAEFSGGDSDMPAVPETSFSVDGGGGFWNIDNFNQFYWSGRSVGQAVVRTEGIGTDISLSILSLATYEEAHTLHGVQMYYANRGIQR